MDETTKNLTPIFKPLRAKFKPFNIPLGKVFLILAVAVMGVALAIVTGNIKHEVTTEYTKAEYATLTSDYESVHSSMSSLEYQRQSQNLDSVNDLVLTQAQKDVIDKARAYGITANMSKEEVDALVPKHHKVQEPLFPDAARWIVLVALPIVVLAVLFIEINRTSLYLELKRFFKFQSEQKLYKNMPVSYVERNGVDYFSLIKPRTN